MVAGEGGSRMTKFLQSLQVFQDDLKGSALRLLAWPDTLAGGLSLGTTEFRVAPEILAEAVSDLLSSTRFHFR